jgi:2-keto-4-pentenoate hydratase/2-oxohepta-3-ene-1,7-dioic acid hydratase in catechol pathway
MRLVTYQAPAGARVAAVRDDGLVDLNGADAGLPSCIKALLAQGPEGLARAKAAMRSASAIARDGVKLLPPIPGPQKVICVGANYADHARESGVRPPDEPILFSKFPTAVRADGDEIVLPAVSSEVDYEAELVVVIGVGGRHIPRAKAFEHVAAYACGNDVSARDWQLRKPGNQWLLGKSFDSFAPFGPELVTADEIPEPGNLQIQLRLNGQTMQHSSTRHFIFPIDVLIAYISQVCTLVPGDLIFTGTPEGVGFARKPPVFLKPGDEVEVEIERIGILRNRVVAES